VGTLASIYLLYFAYLLLVASLLHDSTWLVVTALALLGSSVLIGWFNWNATLYSIDLTFWAEDLDDTSSWVHFVSIAGLAAFGLGALVGVLKALRSRDAMGHLGASGGGTP